MQMARWTGLEPATPGVTGRYSNQLSYHRRFAPDCSGVEGYYASASAASSGFRDGFSTIWRGNKFGVIFGGQFKAAMCPIAGAPSLFCGL